MVKIFAFSHLSLVLALASACSSRSSGAPNSATKGPPGIATNPNPNVDGGSSATTPPSADGGEGPGTLPDGAKAPSSGSPAANFAAKLGAHAGHFLVGMGNDNTDVYTLGVTLDLHYEYLTGLSTQQGWTTWNSNPDYAADLINNAKSHGVIPMFAYYCMAADGENNLPGSVGNTAYMTTYWKDFIELLGDVKTAGSHVVILHEPDFWGFAEQAAITAGGPDKVVAMVSAAGASECSGLPDTLVGFGQCLVKLTRSRAPTALLGFHASSWGTNMDIASNTDKSLDVVGEANKSVTYFKAVGADQADFLSTDVIDRDAGCYEVAGPNCGSTPRTGVYWDETNATLPNFQQQLTWVKAMTTGLGLPMMWWQLPFGEPSTTPGGTSGHFRDNRVHYIFQHISDYVAAGGVGAVWGTGAGSQTDVTTDNDEYKTAATAYLKAPTPL